MKVSVNKKSVNPTPGTRSYQQLQNFIQMLSTWDSIAKYAKCAAFLAYGLDECSKNAKAQMASFQVIQAKGELIDDPAMLNFFGSRFGSYDVVISATLYSYRGIITLQTRLSCLCDLHSYMGKKEIDARISSTKYVRETT